MTSSHCQTSGGKPVALKSISEESDRMSRDALRQTRFRTVQLSDARYVVFLGRKNTHDRPDSQVAHLMNSMKLVIPLHFIS